MNDEIKIIANWLGAGSINIFGCPFSGKDTQGRILADLFGGVLIAGGDILRSHHDPEKIKQVLANGGIVPSDFYLGMVLPYLSQPELTGKPLILSAVGRSHGEEPAIMKATTDSGHPLKAVILLNLSEEEVWRRFEAETAEAQHDRGKRSDDHRTVLKTRLKKFQTNTIPVIEFYRGKGLLIEVDGVLSRGKVTNEILKGLLGYISKLS
jgi:adenylate kinase